MGGFVNVDAYLEEIKEYMPHYVFYRRGYSAPELVGFGDYCESEKNSKLTDCYCTACNTRYEDGVNKPSAYKHKEYGKCANCGATVQRRAMGRGRAGLRESMNFAVFQGAGELVRISCIRATLTFPNDALEPEYEWYEVTRYQLEPYYAIQYRTVWDTFNREYVWVEKQSKPSEPNFNLGPYYADHSYTLVNCGAIENSFLKYIDGEWTDREHLPSYYIEWLCRYAEHPQIEYFVKGGLYKLAENIVRHRTKNVRFNWKSNDLKKILKITKPELEYLQESDGNMYCEYIGFRRHIFSSTNPAETIRYHRSFYNCEELIKLVSSLTGLRYKKIMDYALKKQNKQGVYFLMTCWKDYLNDCNSLEYDLHNETIAMPKDIWQEHDKVMKLVKVREDELLSKKMKRLVEERKEMEVTDMELGLIIRQPYTAKEIIAEGKALDHCVGGYAERHANGATTIMFLRRLSDPMKPYYTMEVGTDLKIKQCYGYKNNRNSPKTQDIELFEERYQEYLDLLAKKREKKKKAEKRKKQHKERAAA